MCIAIVKKKNGKITDEELKNCFNNNPDGAGLAYSKDNQLYYIKGIFDEKVFIQAVREAEKEADGAMLIHCRIGTSGLKDKENCHPHIVNGNCVMIHNGILDIEVPKNSKISDTVIFVNELLKPLKNNFMKDESILNLLSFAIGNGNKFCFLNEKGEYAIVNEDLGEWVNDVWFSNNSYSYDKSTFFFKGNKKSFWDDYEEEHYGDNYYNTKITEKEYWHILEIIENLKPTDLIEMGEFPIYDNWSRDLKPEMEFEGAGEAYLMDIDYELQEIYEEKYARYVQKSEVA